MSSTVSVATWLPSAIARLAVPAPAPAGPRHLAPDIEDIRMDAVGTVAGGSTGRHAEPEWSREQFDPRRDDDPFAWLGFGEN